MIFLRIFFVLLVPQGVFWVFNKVSQADWFQRLNPVCSGAFHGAIYGGSLIGMILFVSLGFDIFQISYLLLLIYSSIICAGGGALIGWLFDYLRKNPELINELYPDGRVSLIREFKAFRNMPNTYKIGLIVFLISAIGSAFLFVRIIDIFD